MVDTPVFRDTSEFSATIDAAAEQLGISALAVEKDYWVSEVLRTLAHDFPSDFIFKGGTSLSKGYHLIQRFSDDIDLLILPRGRGRNAVDRLMKTMSEHATAMTGGADGSLRDRPSSGVRRELPGDPSPDGSRPYDGAARDGCARRRLPTRHSRDHLALGRRSHDDGSRAR